MICDNCKRPVATPSDERDHRINARRLCWVALDGPHESCVAPVAPETREERMKGLLQATLPWLIELDDYVLDEEDAANLAELRVLIAEEIA